MNLSTLRPGDLIVLTDGRTREVVRVVDLDGARGGIVDCKAPGGRASRTSGFELGDTVAGFAPGPVRHRDGLVAIG